LRSVVDRTSGRTSGIEGSYVTREELRNMIKTGEHEGVIGEERQLLQLSLRFTDATAKEVMTPRLDMAADSIDATVTEAIETCIQSRHARLPAYDDSLHSVVSVFDIRELKPPRSAC
jgi:CBS domain containing-hemolysin-like protein